MACGLFGSAAQQGVDGGGREGGGGVAADVDVHHNVTHRDVVVVLVLAVDVDDLHQEREDSGNGHRGAHGLLEVAGVEVDLGVGDDVRGHAGKGDGQGVEVDGVQIALEEVVEEVVQVDAADESGAGIAVAFSGGEGVPEGVGVLQTAGVDVDGLGVDAVGEEEGPVLRAHQRVQLVGAPAHGIEAADERAHGGAGDDVDGQSGLFDGTQGADVRHAFGAAAAEHHGYLGPGKGVGPVRLGVGRHNGECQQGDYEQQVFHCVDRDSRMVRCFLLVGWRRKLSISRCSFRLTWVRMRVS